MFQPHMFATFWPLASISAVNALVILQDWKVRKAAYQQVQTLFEQAPSEDSDVFRDYGKFIFVCILLVFDSIFLQYK